MVRAVYALRTPDARQNPVSAYPRYSFGGETPLAASACAPHRLAGPETYTRTLASSPSTFAAPPFSAYPFATMAFTMASIPRTTRSRASGAVGSDGSGIPGNVSSSKPKRNLA